VSDYFEQEEILRSYDSALMRRMLHYLRPYTLLFVLSVAALLLATAGELLLPVILRRATDSYILPYYRAVRLQSLRPETRALLGPVAGPPGIGVLDGLYFLPSGKLSAVSGREALRMQQEGSLLSENYFVIRQAGGQPDVQQVIAAHPQLFLRDGQIAAITEANLRKLSREEIRIVRRGDYQGLSRVFRSFLVILVGVFISTFFQVYLEAYVGQMIMRDMRTQLYDHTLRRSLKFIDTNPVGRLVSRITNDVETINELFTTVLSSLLKDFSMMIGVMVALFLMSPRLGFISLLTLPPVFVLTALFRVRARDAFRRVRLAVSRLNAFVSEHISGMRIVQMFVQERKTGRQFQERSGELLQASLGEMFVFASFRPLVDLLGTVSLAVVVYFGAKFLQSDLVSLGVLIAFLNLIRMFYQPVMDLSEKYNILQSAMAGAERVFALLDTTEAIPEPARGVSLQRVTGLIEFDRVCFSYKEGEPVLKDLSFTVNPGETVAIVGYTGAGKTTITSLLTRLWDVQSGSIRLDGVDIRDMPTSDLRSRVQSVLQEVFLFSGTILDNIRLGSEIPLEKVHRAVRLARADSFIEGYPEGLETQLHERGSNLSMGQRQLLSFARVLAHNPDVLVLDEATGNIDTETEKLIQNALEKLLKDRTSLVIAHRLSTIRHADRILVLHKGQLCESGTHEQLIHKRGMYYNLYRMQYLDQAEASAAEAQSSTLRPS
jgi:ATP-binding cassette subfamily B multidrug efflux pump